MSPFTPKSVKYFCSFAALLLLTLSESGCYLTRLAFKQNNLFNSRRPIPEVVSDPKTSEATRSALRRLGDIMAFAQLAGLNTEESYRYYIDIPGGIISYTVQAAEPFAFKSRTWWFPVVGRVPYLGFFEKAERDSEAQKLKSEGLDVFSGGVGGFSSLGWFEDPVYSPMLERNIADLALLFFHELTHRTFWQADAALFNEQLAEFVGRKLTREYLKARGLDDDLTRIETVFRDEKRLKEWTKNLKAELESFYDTVKGRKPTPEDLEQKKAIFQKYKTTLLPKWESTAFAYVAKREWNNAVLLGASLYTPDEERFERAFRCSGAIKVGDFLQVLQDHIESADKAFEDLDQICGSIK